MLRPRVIPTLLLKGQGLYKTVKFKNPVYIGDPLNAVKIFNEKEVDEIVLLDIGASVNKTGPQFDLIREIANECFMPLAYGGGITDVAQVRRILGSGVEKIILNTSAARDPDLVKAVADVAGNSAVVVSIDVRKKLLGRHEVFVKGGQEGTGYDPVEYACRMQELGAGEILVNSIDRDGTMQGYDLAFVKKMCEAVSVPVIACGGAGSMHDFRDAIHAGANGVAAGSFFVFQGKYRAVLISYPSPRDIESLVF